MRDAVEAGQEVVIPDLTFAATAHAVIQTGAVPVLADVAAERVKELLTPDKAALVKLITA